MPRSGRISQRDSAELTGCPVLILDVGSLMGSLVGQRGDSPCVYREYLCVREWAAWRDRQTVVRELGSIWPVLAAGVS